ncbi:MAG: oligosaccharide flippase family protein, partial [Bacteroidota bacterium]
MLYTLKSKISGSLKKDNERSQKIQSNIFLSLLIKGGSVLVGLLLVSVSISFISPVNFGVWLTISSVISWISFFDIGLGNGLRNKLAQALALSDYNSAKIYISTTYAILSLIAFALLILFITINPFFNWNKILSIPTSVTSDISVVTLIVLCGFCIQFVVQTINIVLLATHETAIASMVSFLGQLSILATILIFKNFISGNLVFWALASTLPPILVSSIASLYFYSKKSTSIAPSFKKIDFKYSKNILQTGSIFFVIQIGAIILFNTDNIVITKVIGPSAVTEFNVCFKLYSVVTMVFAIIMTPYWSAFTDAYTKKDFNWIKNNLIKIRNLWTALAFVIIPVIYFLAPYIFSIWIGYTIKIHNSTSLA